MAVSEDLLGSRLHDVAVAEADDVPHIPRARAEYESGGELDAPDYNPPP